MKTIFHRKIWPVCLFLLLALAAAVLTVPRSRQSFYAANGEAQPDILVIDAGHGGADGGAVTAAGEPESDINLAIAQRCRLLCLLLGQDAIMTRSSGDSLADPDASTIRRQKVSDTKNRVELVNATPGATLVSIHQNSLPSSPKTHGAIVFYNGAVSAETLAKSIQTALQPVANADGEKAARRISDDIYLMSHIDCPGILVECGFLSNPTEAAMLSQPSYQNQLAVAILCGYLQYKG